MEIYTSSVSSSDIHRTVYGMKIKAHLLADVISLTEFTQRIKLVTKIPFLTNSEPEALPIAGCGTSISVLFGKFRTRVTDHLEDALCDCFPGMRVST